MVLQEGLHEEAHKEKPRYLRGLDCLVFRPFLVNVVSDILEVVEMVLVVVLEVVNVVLDLEGPRVST